MRNDRNKLWNAVLAAACLSLLLTACGGQESKGAASAGAAGSLEARIEAGTETHIEAGTETDTEISETKSDSIQTGTKIIPQQKTETVSQTKAGGVSVVSPGLPPEQERQEKEPSSESQEEMQAVVKEVDEGKLLVSSRSDRFPGAYYVYLSDIDPDRIKAGDEIVIYWDGSVLETLPAQIYADSISFE